MSETHVNALKQDLADALNDARKALGDVEAKVEAVLTKLESDANTANTDAVEPTPASEPVAPEAPALPTQSEVSATNAESVDTAQKPSK